MAGENPAGVADTSNAEGLARLGDIVNALSTLNSTIGNTFPNWVSVPANSSASGVAGQVAYDGMHFYWCVSSNSWVRVTGSTF